MGSCVSKSGQVAGEDENNEEEEEQYEEDEDEDAFLIKTVPFADFVFQNEPIIHDYEFIKCVSSKSFSSIYLVKNVQTNRYFIAKVYQFSQFIIKDAEENIQPYYRIQNSLDIVSELNHRYIISLVDAFTDEITNTLNIIMPLAALGNLKTLYRKKQCTQSLINLCFLQTAMALSYMHSKNIVHRDVKPENILAISEDLFVLTDFYLAQHVKDDEKVSDITGTIGFLAPEIFNGNEYSPKPADVWAFGVSLYEICFGKLPFNIETNEEYSYLEAFEHVKLCLDTNELEIPTDDKMLSDLLKKILQLSPANRPTFDQIIADPFFDPARPVEKEIEKEDNQYQ
ncbi:AGC family protein kinase [Trichomonas vaginalis G3]|uniref:AGC family protein kinase n=1 Tax=Trichomonas vaginalis (strain ATCC PRA-98 / G3) TaxID=412133 RepID=A2DPI4_TRIV3|nr:histone serine kinase protein [Trichomonas vaginalis G3]EAY17728.1 AGC family protein kinase [Trichomonas vaginalis G3]KAI5507868.1 histone serine kinase protein [Trichomonas vaginalis G3]|eukprot:XP_001329863.1 AGC family protein kinase [Trichomonas vaginalis G3]